MRRILLGLAATAIVVTGVLVFRPLPVEPVATDLPPAPPLAGAFEPNRDLESVELVGEGRLPGPEDVERDERGALYAGLEDGTIRRIVRTASGERIEIFSRTDGRPLGLDLDRSGTLWVADTRLGLVAVGRDGRSTVRVAEAGGVPFGFADDVDTAPDGRVYFSDASTRIGPDQIHLAPFEGSPSGRLLEYDPALDATRVLLDGLHFANGVAVAVTGDYVLVAETFRYRVRRYWLTGPRQGESEIFVDNLPGFPDGVSSDGRGGYWLALFTVRIDLLDRVVHPRPWLARLVARIPSALQPGARPYGLVVALDATGRVVRTLHDPAGGHYPNVTSVEEWDDALYLGSIEGRAIGRLPLAPAKR